MNCDQVFDILTRGPFPTGTSCDIPVETHLSQCPECHRLAEALRPAVELFQEAVDPEESRDLPGYWCAVATDRQLPALSYASEIERRAMVPQVAAREPAAGHLSALMAWRMAAMLALGVTVGLLFSNRVWDGIGWPPRAAAPAASIPADDGIGKLTKADLAELAVLPAACNRHQPDRGPRYSIRHDQLLASAGLEQLSCCSGCHNAASDVAPSAATGKVAQSCQLCHAGSTPSLVPGR